MNEEHFRVLCDSEDTTLPLIGYSLFVVIDNKAKLSWWGLFNA